MRCPDCQKFVSFDAEVEPEEQNGPEFDGTGVEAEYRRVLTCQECGTELKESMITVMAEVEWGKDTTPADECPGENAVEGEHEWEIEDASAEATIGTIDRDRHGKKIKNPRYMKITYGVNISGTVKCANCNAEGTYNGDAAETASGFDELT
jgi:hypothetical protein